MLLKIAQLKKGSRRVDVEGTIKTIQPVKTLELPEPLQPARYTTATLEDETGAITLTLWNYDIEKASEGARVKIENGYVTAYKGQLQLNIGLYGRITTIHKPAHPQRPIPATITAEH